MDLKDLRLKLNWEMVKDVPGIIEKKRFRHSSCYAGRIDPFQSKDWQLVFHFVTGGKNGVMISVRMHFDADPLFNYESHWITDKKAHIETRKQNYDELLLARVRVMRLVYDLCDTMENKFEAIEKDYKLDYNKEIQLKIFDTGAWDFYN